MSFKAIFRRPSLLGTAIGMAFMALALTPSLIPRTWTIQAVVAGITFIVGYGMGVGGSALWQYLGLPAIPHAHQRTATLAALGSAGALLAYFLFRMAGWQNEVRQMVGLAPVDSAYPLRTLLLAAVVIAVLLIFFRFLAWLIAKVTHLIAQFVPQRIGRVLGVAMGLLLVILLINGVLVDSFFNALNATYSVRNSQNYDNVFQPTSTLRAGSPDSYLAWDNLGRQGRRFVATGPTAAEIGEFWGEAATAEPIRIYIGVKSAPTLEERAELALQELLRTNAFDRDLLILVTSTGSGWVDANAIDAIEYIFQGDTAIVAFQYSYLPSLYSILADKDAASDSSVAMFDKIHQHWRTLDAAARPGFYLYALSLGTFGSQAAVTSVSQFNDPVNGALWAGPPFVSEFWQHITHNRDEGSPIWRPVYQDGQTIRFTNAGEGLQATSAEWLDNRFIYLQQADDPIVFFRVDSFFRELEWLKEDQRSPRVIPAMQWYPVVTFWQVLFDMVLAVGDTLPDGNGHRYSSDAYIESWVALTRPQSWTNEQSAALTALFQTLGNLNQP